MPVLAEACNVSDLFESHPELLSQGRCGALHADRGPCAGPGSWSDFQSSLQQAWIAIGPEGDFAPEEVQTLHAKGAIPVNLGSQRLRRKRLEWPPWPDSIRGSTRNGTPVGDVGEKWLLFPSPAQKCSPCLARFSSFLA